MTDNHQHYNPEFDDPWDDPLMRDVARIAGQYPQGTVPGTDPLEILTGLYTGLSRPQLDAVAGSPALLELVRRTWDSAGVSEAIRRAASEGTELGRAHARLLGRLGHSVTIAPEDIDWLLVDLESLTAATKGGRGASGDRWTLDDDYTQASVSVDLGADTLEVGVVPELSRGPALLLVRWADGAVERRRVRLVAGTPVMERFVASGRRVLGIAFVPDAEGATGSS